MKKTLTAIAALAIVVAASLSPASAGGLFGDIANVVKATVPQPPSNLQMNPQFNLGGPGLLGGAGQGMQRN